MTSRIRQIVRNVASNYIALVTYAVVNFLLATYLVRCVGADGFGLIALIHSLSITTELLINGVCQALTKYIAAERARGAMQQITALFNTAIGYFLICGVLAAGIVIVIAWIWLPLFKIPPDMLAEGRRAMTVMALGLAFTFPLTAYQAVLWGLQRYDLANAAKVTALLFRLTVTFLVFHFFPPDILSFIAIVVVSLLIERLLWGFFAKRCCPQATFALHRFSAPLLKGFLGFGSVMLMIHVANLIGYEAVKWLIGLELSLNDVGGYTLIATLVGMAGALTRAIANIVMPISSEYEALQETQRAARLLIQATKYSFIVSGGLCLIPLPILKPLFAMWVGGSYSPADLDVIVASARILFVGQWLMSASLCLQQMLTGKGRLAGPAAITMAWAAGSFLLLGAGFHFGFSIGLLEVVSILAAARLAGSIGHLLYGLRFYLVSPWQFVQNALAGPFVTIFLSIAVGTLLTQMLPPGMLWTLSIGVILTLTYGILVVTVALNQSDLRLLLSSMGYKRK